MEQQLVRRRWLLPLILFMLTLLLLKPAVLPDTPGHALNGNDFTGNFYPLYSFIAEQVSSGNLPLWNPRQFAGFPVAGNPQAAIFYPGTWLIWLMNIGAGVSVPRAMGLMVILHTFIGAWGMACLARRFGVTCTGALAAGILYALSGWMAARFYAGHYTIITVTAWIPFVLAGTHHALYTRTWRSLIAPTAALGCAALAGHPQMVLYAVLGMGVLWGYYIYSGADDTIDRPFIAGLWRLAVIGGGGLILGMALILPTAELVLQTARTDTTLNFVNQFHLPTQQLTTLALPFLYGNPNVTPSRYWGGDFVEETTAYVGLLPLIALLLITQLRDKRVVFWLALVIMGVVLALGADGVLFALFVRWLPGFSLFRSPGRFLYFVTLGLAGITALFITYMQSSTPERRQMTLAPAMKVLPYTTAVLFIASVFFSGWFASASHVEPMPHRAAQVAGVLGYAGLVILALWGVLFLMPKHLNTALVLALLLITWDVWRVSIPLITTSDVADTPLWDGAAVNVPTDDVGRVIAFADPNDYFRNAVNNASITGHQNVEGYDPLEIASYAALENATEANPNHSLYELLGLRYLLTWEPREDDNWQLIGIADGGIYYEKVNPPPRAWIANSAELIPDDNAALQFMRDSSNLQETVILHEPLDCELGSSGTAEIISYEPNTITIETSGDGGVLILSDQYYPGWQAAVDGKSTVIRRAYTALRAVCIPAGEHTVTFSYRPVSVLIGAIVSSIGWVTIAIFALISRSRSSIQ